MKASPGWQFASDNTAGICPEAWNAMATAIQHAAPSYGTDSWTQRACDAIRTVLEYPEAEVFFVFNGTAANSLALAACCQSYHSVICHEFAHVETDECGAPEFFSNGTKLLLASGAHGKLDPEQVEKLVTRRTDLHYPHPRVVSLSQSTELGTVYTVEEISAVAAVAKRHKLYVHMDGARFANALVSNQQRAPGTTAADLTWRAGVDVLCFGGTKNGMQSTEAVVFFNPALAHDFEFRCKQAGQLASKMRFHSSQWLGSLERGAWLRHAAHANAMAQYFATGLAQFPRISLAEAVDGNALFARMPPAWAQAMEKRGWHFYAFIAAGGYRLMCSWDTTQDDIDAFLADLREVAAA
jgi:threonine aldolase